MPKDSSKATRSKRSRAVAVIDTPAERGLLLRMLLHSPKDMVAGLIAFAAVSAIIGNAVFLQAGRHPSPMFGSSTIVALPAPVPAGSPLPKPRPLDAATPSDGKLDSRMLDSRPVDGKSDARTTAVAPSAKPSDSRTSDTRTSDTKAGDPIGNLMKAPPPATNSASVMRPPAPIPHNTRTDPLGDLISNTRRVASVQRALTEFGYGQLKPTGNVGSDTQAAIQRFERERKLPVTGQVNDRMIRELAAVTGRAID